MTIQFPEQQHKALDSAGLVIPRHYEQTTAGL